MSLPTPPEAILLNEFRRRYPQLQTAVYQAVQASFGDSVVLQRLGDDVDEFRTKVTQHILIFPPAEAATLQTNLVVLLGDIRQAYRLALDASHYGKPVILQRVRTGKRGRPKVHIDPEWLRRAYDHRGPSKLARFLGCDRKVISHHLRLNGIGGARGQPPTALAPGGAHPPSGQTSAFTDNQLDEVIRYLRVRFPATGVKVLQGTLMHLRGHVTQKRIRESLLRVDPVRRAFQRTPVLRRHYKVAGPGALVHHDGQHGLIRFGVVMHGFIDGASRLIMALRAHDNNRGATVLALFLHACAAYGVPQRVRGDHGVENIQVAEWMERVKGERRGSYIWGRSIHNIRIERLWVDVTSQFGQKWANFFEVLEACYGLDVNNTAHIWLLHILFLADINADATLFTGSWNNHKMTLRGVATQSPAEMWHFGIAQAGERGEALDVRELEMYGVDWPALQDDSVMGSFRDNNVGADDTVPWTGRVGPPDTMNEVSVDAPECPIDSATGFLTALRVALAQYQGVVHPVPLGKRWITGLAFCRLHHPLFFM